MESIKGNFRAGDARDVQQHVYLVVRQAILAFAVTFLLASCSSRDHQTPTKSSDDLSLPSQPPSGNIDPSKPRRKVVEGEWIIKFKPRTSRVTINSALTAASFERRHAFRTVPGLERVRLAANSDVRMALAAMEQRDDVEYIEPNFIVHASSLPNDPKLSEMWNLKSPASFGGIAGADISATQAWDITTGSSNVVIAVIDSGIDYLHEDLAANIFSNVADCDADGIDDDNNGYVDDCHGIDTANVDSDPMDDNNHGTHVAGTIGAIGNNGKGTVGVAWNVRLLPCKFLDENGDGSTADAIECLDYIAALKDRGVNIVASNNSWGSGEPSQALRDAIISQRQHNILFIAAAGNSDVNADITPEYPCSFDLSNIICVGASTLNDSKAQFSNWGPHTLAVQAPGEYIWSTVRDNGYDSKNGTSMAAPHVSGVVALLAAQDLTRDWRALKNLVIAGADLDVGIYAQYNAPHLNAFGSLTCTNTSVLKRLTPAAFEPLISAVGAQHVLKALHITCGVPAGIVQISVAPSNETVTLRDDGIGQDEVSGDGIYSGVWTVPSLGDFRLTLNGGPTDPIDIHVDGQLKPGFPLKMNLSASRDNYIGGNNFGITVGNIAGDSYPEIIATGLLDGPLYAWTHDGTPLIGWPAWDWYGAAMPALGELDGDNSHAEVVAQFPFSLRRYSPLGAPVIGWPRTSVVSFFPPSLADLNGDGRDEVISFPTRYADGSEVGGLFKPPGVSVGAITSADLDSDGRLELVTTDPTSLWATNLDGLLFGFPVSDARTSGVGSWTPNVIGDVDGDGELDIIVAVEPDYQHNGKVHIYSNKGVYKRSMSIQSLNIGEPALADLDGDGIPEIIVTGFHEIYAFKGNGSPVAGWPYVMPANEFYPSYPVIGDITGSGHPSVVVSASTGEYTEDGVSKGHLYALNPNGTLAAGFPRDVKISDRGLTPAIADIDLDGRNDLLITSAGGTGYRDALFAYDFATNGTGPIEWGQYRGGANHRGYYETGKYLPNHAYLTAHVHGGGTISATGNGINCGVDCIERYVKGTNVVLTASPSLGATFASWLGDCFGQGNPCTVNVQNYKSVTARFNTPLNVQIIGSGTGTITANPNGINCPTDCTEVYAADSIVTLTAVAATGSDFDGWSGGCTGTGPQCQVKIDAAKTVIATFVNSRNLIVVKSGTGTGTISVSPSNINCSSICSMDFPPHSTVILTAQPAPGSYLAKWDSACEAFSIAACTLTMDENRYATAIFEKLPVLTITKTGSGGGVVRSNPSGISCGANCSMAASTFNASISLDAIPDSDSVFVTWSVGCTNNAPFCSVVMDRDKVVTANFALRPALTISLTGTSGRGSVTSSTGGINCGSGGPCTTRIDGNTQVVLTAAPITGSVFQGWTGDCAGTSTTCVITMNASKAIGASFGDPPPPPASGGASGGGGGRFDLASLFALLLLSVYRLSVNRRESGRTAPLIAEGVGAMVRRLAQVNLRCTSTHKPEEFSCAKPTARSVLQHY